MFKKLLIANRGEIACRVIRTCKKMGIGTVAVYSDADQNALHVKMADEAYRIGPPPPTESYLSITRILEAAKLSSAGAIHPGYGFLSENPDFPVACEEAGVEFVGPEPHAMEMMGDKLNARLLAKEAGVPVLPGTDKPVDDDRAISTAWMLGFPLMVKATSGGGGIGIHLVHSMEELESVIKKERTLASNAFGSPNLYFERYMEGASHIEVQVMGDKHGNLIHLFARDCSVQRRNQKVIEESPAEKLSPEQRARLWDYGSRLARHIGYTNAGTAEFLVSPNGEMYFLEMNTRLQVEHGVTEMITGLDIVELQLRVAAGEPLDMTQEDVTCNGHAIETRIYPEDPVTFLPSTGVVSKLHEPTGEHVRLDSALFPGYEVTTHYESLMGKLICWGQTREQARKRIYEALDEFKIEGVTWNQEALKSILTHPEFVDSTYNTTLLSRFPGGSMLSHGAGDQSQNGRSANGKVDKELAAAIGLSLILSMNGNSSLSESLRNKSADTWKLYGRREQMFSRMLGSRGWR